MLSVVLMRFQLCISGDMAGPSGGPGSSAHPEKPLIKEDNALATLQAAFPKEVKYKTIKGPPSRSAQSHAFCTTFHGLTGKFGDSMMSHQESRPFVVKLCQSRCNKHQCSMNSIFRFFSFGCHCVTLQVCSDSCRVRNGQMIVMCNAVGSSVRR